MTAFGHGLDTIQWWVICFPTLILIGYSAAVRKRQNADLSNSRDKNQ